MRRQLLGIALFASLCFPVAAQCGAGCQPASGLSIGPLTAFALLQPEPKSASQQPDSSSSSESGGGDNLGLKWFNFAVLAVGLGYLVAKHAPAFFNARTEAIQKAIQDATGLKLDADFRSSEIDRKMATLSAEISKLRTEGEAEMQAEQQRLAKETAQSLAQIQRHEAQEIASLEHNARLELNRHTAELAVSIAASRLRERLTTAGQEALVSRFAGQVSARQPGGAR
jgi:F0F1-type ATP synthase membrane subunit b/b'